MPQSAAQSLTEPGGSIALTGAGQWLTDALLGSVASSIAVLAIATVGLLLLLGRLDVRRGASVVLGAFILFGAAQIAGGLSRRSQADAPNISLAPFESASPIPQNPRPIKPGDPYAGASYTPPK